jgi:hypothetical protein
LGAWLWIRRSRQQTTLPDALDRDTDIYGICTFESCRARQYDLSRQRQRKAVRVGRGGKPDTDDLGASDRYSLVDGVHQVRSFLRYVCDPYGIAEGAQPLDGALRG